MCEANKNKKQNPRERTGTNHTTKSQTHARRGQTRTKKNKGGKPATPKKRRQRGRANHQRRKGGAGGKREAAASKKAKRGRPGRQQGQEGGNRTSQEDERVQLYRCPKGVQAPYPHPQHGVEGRAPHRAEAFVAMRSSEGRIQSATTHLTKGMATGP